MITTETRVSFGAILIGGILAFILSGIVTSQTFSYFQRYPNDQRIIKLMISFIWFMDSWHTFFVAALLWDHFIAHYGDPTRIDAIPWSLGLTVLCTAIVTILVHIFFIYRIFKLSHNNYFVAAPLGIISGVRFIFAFLTTVRMIQLHSVSRFVHLYSWAFSTGLVICSVLDILFAGCLCYFLRQNLKKNSSMNEIIKTLMLYAFRNGILNCLVSIATLICWLAIPKLLVFLGIHFVISKLYANSVISVINARQDLRQTTARSQVTESGDGNRVIMYSAGTLGLGEYSPPLQVLVKQEQTTSTGGKTSMEGSTMV